MAYPSCVQRYGRPDQFGRLNDFFILFQPVSGILPEQCSLYRHSVEIKFCIVSFPYDMCGTRGGLKRARRFGSAAQVAAETAQTPSMLDFQSLL